MNEEEVAVSGPCSFGRGTTPCPRDAAWVILVGLDQQHLACDEHRNDVLARFDPKDVSGLVRTDEVGSDG